MRKSGEKIAFEALVKEAGEFYSLTVKIATLFLGGIIVLIEKIAPHKTSCLMCIAYSFLVVGIFFLLATIYLTLLIRKKNIESATYALRQQYQESQRLDIEKEILMKWMVRLLVWGIGLVTIFGLISFFSKINQEGIRMDKKPSQVSNSNSVLEKNIPFSQARPINTNASNLQSGESQAGNQGNTSSNSQKED